MRQRLDQPATRRLPRDLWMIFGDIRRHASIEDAIVSGRADFVRLASSDIGQVYDAIAQSLPLPMAVRNRSALPFVGALSCIDDIQELAHQINECVGRSNVRLLNASRLISDKEMMYRMLETQGIAVPARLIARDIGDLEQVLCSLHGSLRDYVIKPVVGTESRGVLRPATNDRPNDVVAALRRLPDLAASEPMIVMPYVSARGTSQEYCLDGVVVGNVVRFHAIHEKTRIFEGYPIHDRAMVTPPRKPLQEDVVDDFLTRFARAFPIASFVFHLEVRLDDGGQLVPIDLSFRPGGGLIFRSVMECYGLDLRLAHTYCCLHLDDELQRLASTARRISKCAAIAAVFNLDQPQDVLRARLAGCMGDGQLTLASYDMANVSILSAASQTIKPNVGLCVTSTGSSLDVLAGLDELVFQSGMSLTSRQEPLGRDATPARLEASAAPELPCNAAPQRVIHTTFAECAAKFPDATAVSLAGEHLSYRQLRLWSLALAHQFTDAGVGLETRVGIYLERSFEAVATILGILEVGGCYVPLDTAYPQSRLEHMLRDASITLVVSTSDAAVRLPRWSGAVLLVDRLGRKATSEPIVVAPLVLPSNLACILYTSGSTGEPKGVAVCHGAITNLVLDQNYVDFEGSQCSLHAAPLSFDAATFELWGALLHGKKCALTSGNPPTLQQLYVTVVDEGVDTAWFTSSLFNTIVDEAPEIIGKLRQVITGGEPVSPRHVQQARAAFPQVRIVNGYGPTEATTFTCTFVCEDDVGHLERIPIGKPLRNTEVLVLDAALNPIPVGQEGELYIGGAGLTRGYFNQPGLTAERFLPHPGDRQGKRIYRTGDRVRLRADGNVEFLGRLDRQVKLRGVRIELDEVEHAICRLPWVQAAVASVAGEGANRMLVASVVVDPSCALPPTAHSLRVAISQMLPAGSIPGRLNILDKLPLTTTGKTAKLVIRDEPSALSENDDDAIASDVKAIWHDVLGVGNLKVNDDFFERGGHSLAATRVIARVRNRFGLDIGMRLIFEHSRFSNFVEQLKAQLAASTSPTIGDFTPPITANSRSASIALNNNQVGGPCQRKGRNLERLDLSLSQYRLWYLNQLSDGQDISYNVPFALRLCGRLDFPALQSALNSVITRHDGLRATFPIVDEQPVQCVAASLNFVLELSHHARHELAVQVAAHARHVFDLARGPLFHIRLLQVTEEEHVLLLNLHHIIADGWSLGILVDELSRLYRANVLTEAALMSPPLLQYADYADWQRTRLDNDAIADQLAYWHQELAGAPALLRLPCDRPRPERMTGRGAQVRFVVPENVYEAISDLCFANGVTMFMLLAATYTALLHRLSGQSQVLVGTPVAGRTKAEFEGVIGCFVNTVVLRSVLDDQESFADHLQRIRGIALQAYENQEVPFELVVERLNPARSLSYTPVFQAMLALQNIPMGELDLPGLTVEPFLQELTTTKFDLNLSLSERSTGLAGLLEYNADIFDPGTAERIVLSFIALLHDIAHGDTQRRVDVLDMVGEPTTSHGFDTDRFSAADKDAVERWRQLLDRDWPAAEFPREWPAYTSGVELDFAATEMSFLADQAHRIDLLARDVGVPSERVLLAAFVTLIVRLTGQSELLVGMITSGKLSLLHIETSDDLPFSVLIENVHVAVSEALSSSLPVAIARRAFPHFDDATPLCTASFSHGPSRSTDVTEAWLSPLHLVTTTTDQGLTGRLHSHESPLAQGNVTRFAQMLEQLLSGILIAPGRAVSRLTLLSVVERNRILSGLNPIRAVTVSERSMAQPFEVCAQRMPHATALIAGDQHISYRDLDEASTRLAHLLRSRGLPEGGRVAVVMQRSVAMVVAVYAIAKAGAAYVPIDPAYPRARMALMIEEARVNCIVVHVATSDAILPDSLDVVDIDLLGAELEEQPVTPINLLQLSSSVAYLMYTSGSSGVPKLVQFPIDAAISSIRWLQAQYPVQEGDHNVLKTPLGFDVSIWELFWPLYEGGTLVLAEPYGHHNPTYLQELIERYQVRCVNFVPSMLKVFLDGLPEGRCSSLRWVLSGGERLRPELRDQCHARLPKTALVNLCGPTETHSVTDIVVAHDARSRFVPLGRPSAGYRLYVLDKHLEPVPIGVQGELYIGGDIGLAHGYAGQPALTAERFLPDPFGSPGARMYRSGDLCRYFSDGVLEHLGRADNQVKLHGVRIELSDIESVLNAYEGVANSTVLSFSCGEVQQLVGFIVLVRGTSLALNEVKDKLAATLPRHMVPSQILSLPSIPTLSSGKTDRRALEALWRDHEEQRGTVSDELNHEGTVGRLMRIVHEVLGRREIDIDRGFFDNGGHSLLAFRLIAACQREFSVLLPMQALFTTSSIWELAAEIDVACHRRDLTLLRMSTRSERRDVLVFLVHGVNGTVLQFHHLAARLQEEFEVFAFQSLGIESDDTPPRSVQANAELYVTAAEQVRAGRPVLLVGYSFGGTIAVEMARLWQEQGIPVIATILLDSYVLGTAYDLAEGCDSADELNDVLRQIDFLRIEPPDDASLQVMARRMQHVLDCNLHSFVNYAPTPFHGAVDLFYAKDGFPELTAQLQARYAMPVRNLSSYLDCVRACPIDGDHMNLLAERYCDGLADKIRIVVQEFNRGLT